MNLNDGAGQSVIMSKQGRDAEPDSSKQMAIMNPAMANGISPGISNSSLHCSNRLHGQLKRSPCV